MSRATCPHYSIRVQVGPPAAAAGGHGLLLPGEVRGAVREVALHTRHPPQPHHCHHNNNNYNYNYNYNYYNNCYYYSSYHNGNPNNNKSNDYFNNHQEHNSNTSDGDF